MRLLLLVTAAALLMFTTRGAAAQTAAQAPKAETSPAGDAQNGKRVFASHKCSICHGAKGQGGLGPKIGPPGSSFSAFVLYVRQPTGKMAPVTSQDLPNSELADIYAFLRSMGPAPQTPVSAAAGNVQNGKRIYASYGCFQCHGYEGQGSKQTGATRIGPPAISLAAFSSYTRQPTGQMPPYTSKVVSDSDIADIYAFLQSIPAAPPAKSIPLLNQ